jgi:hypothetical protein
VTQSQAAAVAKLKELKSLLNQGLISQSQYQADSQKLLNEIVQWRRRRDAANATSRITGP